LLLLLLFWFSIPAGNLLLLLPLPLPLPLFLSIPQESAVASSAAAVPAVAFASEISLGFSPGIRTHHNAGFSPWVCSPTSRHNEIGRHQIFVYHIAARRGHDVDQPRNLAKSVTVE